MREMKTGKVIVATLLAGIALQIHSIPVNAATFVKLADEWGTIQSAGARSGNNGIRFWNIQGVNSGFESTGTVRFYMEDLKVQLDSEFGVDNWQIDNVTMVIEQQNAGFTFNGAVDVYHVTEDDVAFTNGESEGTPGDFLPLGVSPLFFDANAPAQTGGANLGTVTLVNQYDFIEESTFMDADVLGEIDTIDPTGAVDLAPNYSVNLPDDTLSPTDTKALFDAEILQKSGQWLDFPTIKADLEDGDDALSLIFAPGDADVSATYKGNFFIDAYPPRLYIEASTLGGGGPTFIPGDFNGDNMVDGADYALYADSIGLDGDTVFADGSNVGGTVTTADYDLWRSNFGNTNPPLVGGGEGAVPEPTTLVSVALALGLGLVLRKRIG